MPDLLSVNLTIENITLYNFSLGKSGPSLLEIIDENRLVLNIFDFEGHIEANYMFITDPPILADIGSFHFDSKNLTLKLDGSNYFNDGILQVDLNAVDFDLEPFNIDMDGINDMSDVVTRLLTFGGNTLTSRLSSMSKFPPVLPKLSSLMNAFF